ncbi:MAG: hypothetical protein LBJ40_05860 [Delftia acidovorans]|jgi:hypothetical protein|uniref:hypothetical protein n=1 Tax=Delftia acidovorans TaxID=80866 RepID=UPI00282DE619|nr:hypothetical protein [Delftia acidovorans]
MTGTVFPDLLVVHVNEPGDEAASVTLASDQAVVTVFCHPCTLRAGQRVRNRLSALDVRLLQSPYGFDWPQDEREKPGRDRLTRTGHYAYSGTGRVIDADRGLVLVHGLLIDFGKVPDVDHVEFDIVRLDWEGDALDEEARAVVGH